VDKVHGFFWQGIRDGRHLYDEVTYQRDVLACDPKNRFRASCLWLVEVHALTPQDVETLERFEVIGTRSRMNFPNSSSIQNLTYGRTCCARDSNVFAGWVSFGAASK
jgi:hypothetical protein